MEGIFWEFVLNRLFFVEGGGMFLVDLGFCYFNLIKERDVYEVFFRVNVLKFENLKRFYFCRRLGEFRRI